MINQVWNGTAVAVYITGKMNGLPISGIPRALSLSKKTYSAITAAIPKPPPTWLNIRYSTNIVSLPKNLNLENA